MGDEGVNSANCRDGEAKDVLPLRSASWKRSSTGTGTKTQFSGFGKTPTGEL